MDQDYFDEVMDVYHELCGGFPEDDFDINDEEENLIIDDDFEDDEDDEDYMYTQNVFGREQKVIFKDLD